MADVFPDIFAGLKNYFAGQLTAKDVIIGFPDDRGTEEGQEFPQVSITLVDAVRDTDNGYSGMSHSRENNSEMTKATMTPVPHPIRLFFQLDTFCEVRLHEWKLMGQILSLLIGRVLIETDGGRRLRPSSPSYDSLDHLEDGLFRKSFRFAVTAWIDDPRDAEEIFLILETRINVNNQAIAATG